MGFKEIYGSNGTSSVRFAVGSNSQILSTTGTGLLWKTPGTARSRFERIATSSVTASGSVTRIAFESIPSTYTHLLIKGKCGTSGSSSERFININFNRLS